MHRPSCHLAHTQYGRTARLQHQHYHTHGLHNIYHFSGKLHYTSRWRRCVCFPRDFMITFNVTDFSIGKTPTSIQLSRGSSTSVNITASGVFGFTGTISLTATIIPVLKHAPALSSLETIELSAAEPTGIVSLTVSTQHSTRVGTYTILIIASSRNISRTLFIFLSVAK